MIDRVPSDLSSLKSKMDKLDVDKLAPVPDDSKKIKWSGR